MTIEKIELVPYAEASRRFIPEIIDLYERSGWGSDYKPDETHDAFLKTMTLVALMRTKNTESVVGVLRGFTDGKFIAWVGEIVVEPALKNRGLGTALLDKFLAKCGAQAAYLDALGDSHHFFGARGFKARPALTAMSKKMPSMALPE